MDSELNALENGSLERSEDCIPDADQDESPLSLAPSHLVITSNFKRTPWAQCKSTLIHYRVIFLFIFLAVVCFTAAVAVYFATIRKSWINVHLVPHSHEDVGWLRTPETYYEHTVKYILNNVVYELERNPKRKFTFVETYFFWRWWQQQGTDTQATVKRLVESGQLQFAGGGWTMNDEAAISYQSIIDQFSWGLRKLNETFGKAGNPTVGWQIDTFGHSREMASLLPQMGFTGLFFARIDEDERRQRRNARAMEFIWEDRNGATSILTNVMYKHYNPPSGYHYEKEVNEGANLDGFLEAVREWAAAYQTQNVLVPMGDDFTYYDARAWYDNMDSLMRQVEERKDSVNVNMFYSTPEQYLRAIRHSSTVFPVKSYGDFFPYASDIFSYWTGYYTSRPSLKLSDRVSNNVLQTTKQLLAMTEVSEAAEQKLTELREAVGVLMHHDAITGTSKQGVNDHYMVLLHQAVMACFDVIIDTIGKVSLNANKAKSPLMEPCLFLNESSCPISEISKQFVVTAYNSLSWPVSHVLRFPVNFDFYTVRNYQGDVVESQVVAIPHEVVTLPGRTSTASKELVFVATDIPPFGFTSFHISLEQRPTLDTISSPVSSNVTMDFHQFTGRLTRITREGHPLALHQDVEYYIGAPFWTGAYIFRPSDPYPYSVGPQADNRRIVDGPVVMETHQSLGRWVSQAIRVYKSFPAIEFEWLVGPIPTDDYHGKEVITRYSTNISSAGVFFTDTNGRGTLRRRRNKRDDWAYTPHELVSGNYYPVTSHISLSDHHNTVAVLTDRAQGGSSLRDGQIELMVHRRLCYDDGKGVNEPLNETAYGAGLVVRGRHWLLTGPSGPHMDRHVKLLALQLHQPPLLLFAPTEHDFYYWSRNYLPRYEGVDSSALPGSVRILTLEPWSEGLLLLRLEHMFDNAPNSPFAHTVTCNLPGIFKKSLKIVAVRETMLAADRWADEGGSWAAVTADLPFIITLPPASIRTFLLRITRL